MQLFKQEQSDFKQEQSGMKQEMQLFKQEQSGMKQVMQHFKQEQRGMKHEVQAVSKRLVNIESLVADIPLMRQATLETLDITKRHESSLQSFESKIASHLSTHDFSIDILHREQLKIKTEIERIKQR